jgi:hypothetical protein
MTEEPTASICVRREATVCVFCVPLLLKRPGRDAGDSEASRGHANCEAMERREWMPSFAKMFST